MSHDLFKFWKISDSISIMVQDRNIQGPNTSEILTITWFLAAK